MRNLNSTAVWKRSILLIGLFGALAAVYAAIQLVLDGMAFDNYIRSIASFACFGCLLGGIYSFDAESEVKVANQPLLRTFVGCIAGAAVGLLWRWPLEGMVISALIGALLGLAGMAWAKYVQF